MDLSGAETVDAAALGTLVMLATWVRAHGGTFRVAHVSEAVRAVLALTTLDGILLGAAEEYAPRDSARGGLSVRPARVAGAVGRGRFAGPWSRRPPSRARLHR